MNPTIAAATARRVLAQLRGDRRTVALLLVVPSALLVLINQMFDSRSTFDRIALLLLGIFPFTTMFLVTSVAMLRERTSGTLERLLTTPMSKLDLLFGYGMAFALAAAAQAAVTSVVAYGALGLSTPGSPWLVATIAVLGAVLGMALGLLVSAFASSEFQAVQFMPAFVMPQVLLGGLFVPRDQMVDWLHRLSDALPLTYALDALTEVGRTSLVSGELLRDMAVVAAAALVALGLAAATLRRRAGPIRRRTRRLMLAVPATAIVASTIMGAYVFGQSARYVTTDNAYVDGDALPIRANASGTVADWTVAVGSSVHTGQPVGRIQVDTGFSRSQQVVRAPADGTVVLNDITEGVYVTTGTQLAVATDLSRIYITARVDEVSINRVRTGQAADITVDAFPDTPLTGTVYDIRRSTAAAEGPLPGDAATGRFQPAMQYVPVTIAIPDTRGLALLPGMSVSARIHLD